MKELYLLNKQLDSLWNQIPRYERDKHIETPESIAYNEFLNKFVEYGRKVLDNQTLNYEQIQSKITEWSMHLVKELLSKDNQEIYDNIMVNADENYEIYKDNMVRLEECLTEKETNEWEFQNDELYTNDKKFLAHFSNEDIEKFKNFQIFLGNKFSEETENIQPKK